MFYEKVFKAFAEAELEYTVIGGIAVNLQGFARATADLDIVIILNDEELNKFIFTVEQIGFIPRLPVNLKDLADSKKREEWIQQKSMKVFSVHNPKQIMETIDVMIDVPVEIDDIFQRRIWMDYQDIQIPVASIPDLIALKECAGRERDKIDIDALRKIEEIQHAKD
ncbi:MAG: nucleotidyl transferase AbiEii/AbiGii toxin family protein [SAR324 cluster bacterium]|nr:nucleotidyl transferase AbiEii/AbiGii toxin family protein [SAR324 cluster bacterium]